MLELSEFLRKFNGVKGHDGKHTALCPAHADQRHSLSIARGDKGIVLHCHAGCQTVDVLAAVGLTMADILPEIGEGHGGRGEIVQTYDYTDAAGGLLYQVVRMIPKDFRQRKPDPSQPSGWSWSTAGVHRVPYHLPRLVDAVEARKTVYVVEGEKDVHSLEALGLPATTSAGGANSWRAEYAEHLRGADVVVLPDHDAAGEGYALAIQQSLAGVAKRCRIVRLPDLTEHQDVTDWLARGHGKDDLLRECAPPAPPPWERPLTPAETIVAISIEPPQVKWLIDGIRPAGIIGCTVAQGGTGKTNFWLQLSYHMAAGEPWGPFRPTKRCNVLMLCAEDPQEVINQRLWRIGRGFYPAGLHVKSVLGQCGPLVKHDGMNIVPSEWFGWLDKTIELHGNLDLVIIDPRSRFYGCEENDNDLATQWLTHMEGLCLRRGVAQESTHHVGKGKSDGKLSQDMARGASAFVDGVRSVFGLAPADPKMVEQRGENADNLIRFQILKNNYGPKPTKEYYFEVGDGGFLTPVDPKQEILIQLQAEVLAAIRQIRAPVTRREICGAKTDTAKAVLELIREGIPGVDVKEINSAIGDLIYQKRLFERPRIGSRGPAKMILSFLPQDIAEAE